MRSLLLIPLLLLLAACGGDSSPAKLNIGMVAPAFDARHVDGMPARAATWAGKPLVIRFWADWCKFCEGEMQAIDKVYRRLKPRGLEVIAINAGQDGKTVAAFMQKSASATRRCWMRTPPSPSPTAWSACPPPISSMCAAWSASS
jgi:cytochrome c biogenesis protein CcmG/thiol:disulfide interchange protein DsbE